MAATKLHATKKRSSNVELLRIVAMLMIIIHHFSVHGPWPSGGGYRSGFSSRFSFLWRKDRLRYLCADYWLFYDQIAI